MLIKTNTLFYDSDKMVGFISANILALSMVYISAFITGDVNDLVGHPIWLQIGAITMSYLLFGFRVFLGVFVGIILSGYFIWHWSGSYLNYLQALAGSLSPLIAIQSMKVFKLSKFFEGEKLIFEHVIFLAIMSGVVNTLLKLFINTTVRNKVLYPDLPPKQIDVLEFIQSYMYGDIVGGISFIFIMALFVTPIISFITPKILKRG